MVKVNINKENILFMIEFLEYDPGIKSNGRGFAKVAHLSDFCCWRQEVLQQGPQFLVFLLVCLLRSIYVSPGSSQPGLV